LATASYQIIHDDYSLRIYKDGGELEKFRNLHKGVNFGRMYGASYKRVADLLNIPHDVAKRCLSAVDSQIPQMAKWLQQRGILAEEQGYIQSNTITNRRRYGASATEAMNYPVQSTNADAMKVALAEIRKYIKLHKLDARTVNTVHDEACVVMHKRHLEKHEFFVRDILAASLERFLMGVVPGRASQVIGNHWMK
jgi:DNA polymerase I-like protein with 3'-5' exonuclease and polymerase domains